MLAQAKAEVHQLGFTLVAYMQGTPRSTFTPHHSPSALDRERIMDLESTVRITAECLCKRHSFGTEIPQSRLPLEGNVCHCHSCRHSTGALYVLQSTWPQPRADVNTSGLHKYQFSANIANLFCATCSTPMFSELAWDPGNLGVFSGPLKNIEVAPIKLTNHIYVEDTVDGGASVWLRRPNPDGEEIPRYLKRSGQIPWSWPGVSNLAEPRGEPVQESVGISCHCKGVNLVLHHGDYAGREREELPWYIDPRNNKRLASFDACDSCRLHFGNDIVHWTFTNLADISQANGGPFPRTMTELKTAVDAGDAAVGTLACYQSSPDADRYFCRVCAAGRFLRFRG
ncbi:hypothetical protein J3459_010599 [Metarhizium acridum]|nr:hypothetical protein J3459_010599 [Metarhizium acridum]